MKAPTGLPTGTMLSRIAPLLRFPAAVETEVPLSPECLMSYCRSKAEGALASGARVMARGSLVDVPCVPNMTGGLPPTVFVKVQCYGEVEKIPASGTLNLLTFLAVDVAC